jgi:hypothetical protein
MPDDNLTANELTALIRRVFQPAPEDRSLAILVDLPDDRLPDTPQWRSRRLMAASWTGHIRRCSGLPEVGLFGYRNVRSNNADLPASCWPLDSDQMPEHVSELEQSSAIELTEVLRRHRLVIAPTELSATAPLKTLAPRLGFRAATMPRFSAAMIPALRLDYTEVDRRVRRLKALLDAAHSARLSFAVDGAARHQLDLDLRHRSGHASGGLILEPGTAGNLPSGEAYIVPYEGEVDGVPTTSRGQLPIQHGDEVVVYRVEANSVTGVETPGAVSVAEAARIATEPAAGNLAELGLGVLSEFGIEPIGEVLLDEKLGLHIALGRSEHFGGQVGPDKFSSAEAVVHQDYVYIPRLQPRVAIESVILENPDGSAVELIRAGQYVVGFRS